MAIDKAIDSAQLDADLTSVANAIRTKGGTSAALAFPAGFVSAVEAIETGGGGYTADEIASGVEPSGAITVTATKLKNYAFYDCAEITSLVITNDIPWKNWGLSAFANCTSLTTVDAPNLTQLRDKIFNGCAKLKDCNFPKVTNIGGDQVIEGTAVETLVFPAFTGGVYRNSLRNNKSLTTVDLNACTSLGGNCFSGCTVLSNLVIRGDAVTQMGNINTFTNTPFASGGSGGTLYVPSARIEDFKSATNWSTILGYGNNKILPIEGSIYETQYADGTPIT